MHGCMDACDAWMHGCMDAWMHGYMLYSTYCISYVLCVILPIPGQVLKHMAWYIQYHSGIFATGCGPNKTAPSAPCPANASMSCSDLFLGKCDSNMHLAILPTRKNSSLNLHSGVPLLRGTPWCCTKIQADLAAYEANGIWSG